MKNTSYGRFILRLAGFALVVCGLTVGARAQVTTGSILGTVKDNSGAAVKGARVAVTDVARGATTNYTTDEEGNYNAPGNFNVDGSLAKSFALTEKLRFQFRFEAYNLFNMPYFGFPNASIGSPTAGQIRTTLADNRSL